MSETRKHQATTSRFVPRSLSRTGDAGDRVEYYQYAVTVAELSRSCSSAASRRDPHGRTHERP